jgi:hypothetical protein
MGFDWGDETYKYRVHVIPVADGRFTWRLVVNNGQETQTQESIEDGEQSFETADAAEDAGRARMIELARSEP